MLHDGMTNLSQLRKRPLEADAATSARAADEIDIASSATIAYSSENPAHPVEHLLDGRSGHGATRWMSARSDFIEHIIVEFDKPQPISRLVYEVEEARRERTQEVRVAISSDHGLRSARVHPLSLATAPERRISRLSSPERTAPRERRLTIRAQPRLQLRQPARRAERRVGARLSQAPDVAGWVAIRSYSTADGESAGFLCIVAYVENSLFRRKSAILPVVRSGASLRE